MVRLKSAIHGSPLIEAMRKVHNDLLHLNITLCCNNGSLKTCGLLMAAVSPIIKSIGKLDSLCSEELVIVLPDFSVSQVFTFISILTSEEGPQKSQELALFQDMLDVLGKQPPDMIQNNLTTTPHFNNAAIETAFIKKQSDEENESKYFLNFEWEDSLPPSSGLDDEHYNDDKLKQMKKSTKSQRHNAKKMLSSSSELEEINQEARQSYDQKNGVYICFRCGTERKNTRSMQQHLMWHQKYPDEDFHTSHICKECGKICADHSLLRAHVRLVHSPRTFACTEGNCDKSFKSKEGLKQHLMVHSGVKNFVCSECGYAVRTKHHLTLHVLKRHTEMKKSIPCEVCGKLFRHMSNLKCHFYTHKARLEREHRCETCNLTFRTKKSHDSHMSLHDPSRPFKCSKCALRYKNKDALVAHENTHENLQYKCEFCDIAYTRKDNLKRHMKEKHIPTPAPMTMP